MHRGSCCAHQPHAFPPCGCNMWQVVIFSKTYCPYCTKAKNALKQFLKDGEFLVVEVRGH